MDGIANGQHLRLPGNLIAGQTVRIPTLSIPALMMGAHDGRQVGKRFDVADDFRTQDRVMLHGLQVGAIERVGLVEHLFRNADLAQIVHQRGALQAQGRRKVAIPTVFTAASGVLDAFEKTENSLKLKIAGVVVSYICPLMYMNNPLCGKTPVITNSNKLRTYTSARYYSDAEILKRISGEVR